MARQSNQPKVTDQNPAESGVFVWVYYNSPHGLTFRTPDGREVTVEGFPVSGLLSGPDGKPLPGGQFGVTKVRKDDWDYIHKAYGSMEMFQSGRIFARGKPEDGDAEAAEREELRHGAEPVDPTTTQSKPEDKPKE